MIPGIGIVTILSWPAENEGYVSWEQYDPNGVAVLRRTDYYGERDGEPVDAAQKFEKYNGDGGYPMVKSAEPLVSLADTELPVAEQLNESSTLADVPSEGSADPAAAE